MKNPKNRAGDFLPMCFFWVGGRTIFAIVGGGCFSSVWKNILIFNMSSSSSINNVQTKKQTKQQQPLAKFSLTTLILTALPLVLNGIFLSSSLQWPPENLPIRFSGIRHDSGQPIQAISMDVQVPNFSGTFSMGFSARGHPVKSQVFHSNHKWFSRIHIIQNLYT